jgi:hypothetical protein
MELRHDTSVSRLRQWLSRSSTWTRIGAWAGGVGISPFAFYIGIVLGGQMGGAFMAWLGGEILFLLGIPIGFVAVFAPIVLAGAFVGGLLGAMAESGFRILRRNSR